MCNEYWLDSPNISFLVDNQDGCDANHSHNYHISQWSQVNVSFDEHA